MNFAAVVSGIFGAKPSKTMGRIDFWCDPKTWVFLGPPNVANFGREMGTPAISGTSRLVKSYHHLPRLMGDGFSPSCIRGPYAGKNRKITGNKMSGAAKPW